MKVICKRYYPYGFDDLIPLDYQMFLTGISYDASTIVHPATNEIWYFIRDEQSHEESFSPSDFEDYFISIPEMRKMKLKKIKMNYE